MPIILLLIALLLVPLIIVVTLPFSIVQRYRAGTARRQARPWLALLNAFFLCISLATFFVSATITSAWVPGALSHSAVGFGIGMLVGLLGLYLTHWEPTSRGLHFTPNRWLILALTVGIALRIGFGFWRAWHAWKTTPGDESWLVHSGLAGSMAAGAVVLGYYLVYWTGVWLKGRRNLRR